MLYYQTTAGLKHDIYVSAHPDTSASSDDPVAADGDKVIVSIDGFEDRRGAPHGRILSVLGSANDAHVRTLAIALSVGVRSDFPPEAEEESHRASLDVEAGLREGRTDFRDQIVFTIDPLDAKDFDDAIHIRELPDGDLEVGVHIADVSHYVRPGSALDKEAYERGTSVYLVDRVIPMLPERLSNELCSLRPNKDRFAFSCVMRHQQGSDH